MFTLTPYDCRIGVCPSPGAASQNQASAFDHSKDRRAPHIAAPGDGRTPIVVARYAREALVGLIIAAALILRVPTAVAAPAQEIPAKLVVLTFDDAVK